jgi:urate oxidase
MVRLGENRYGKGEVRVMHVARDARPDGGDVIRDWNVSTSLAGDLAGSHLTGDNANVLTTDAQKNAVYAYAKSLGGVEPEEFGLRLGAHFVGSQPAISRARVGIAQYSWSPLPSNVHSFARSGEATRMTTVITDEDQGASVVTGIEDLVVLKTTESEFWGFPRDEYTTLPETRDRMLATQVSAWWRYRPGVVEGDWAGRYEVARAALIAAFTGTYSYSLQQTLYAMGERVLQELPETCEVQLVLPNKHHFLADLEPFGLTNENEVYLAADRPYGQIEGSILADDAPDPGLAWT